jgi:hypothetical protein
MNYRFIRHRITEEFSAIKDKDKQVNSLPLFPKLFMGDFYDTCFNSLQSKDIGPAFAN